MTPSPLKRSLLAAGGAALLVVTSVGFSYAQTPPSPTRDQRQERNQAVLSLAAAKLGLSEDQLEQALRQARKELGFGRERRGVELRQLLKQDLSVAARTIGISVEELREQVRGSSLASVATAHGVAPATVASALKAAVDAQIDAAVAAGKVPADRAARLKAKVEARVDAFMTRTFPVRKR